MFGNEIKLNNSDHSVLSIECDEKAPREVLSIALEQ